MPRREKDKLSKDLEHYRRWLKFEDDLAADRTSMQINVLTSARFTFVLLLPLLKEAPECAEVSILKPTLEAVGWVQSLCGPVADLIAAKHKLLKATEAGVSLLYCVLMMGFSC